MICGKYEIDEQRTEKLNQTDLLVVLGRGDEEHYYCILRPSIARPSCPYCGNPMVRDQGNMHRDYLDVIKCKKNGNDDAAIITLSLEFRKAKCMSQNCGHVFYPEISVARPYARTTLRLEDAIVRMVLKGVPYSEIATELNEKICRQVVGAIYHRRKKELDADSSENSAWYRELLEDAWFWR